MPINLSLRHVRAFLSVARARSFTRAAEQLHISQPGLSLMLRDLEEQLACRLFERTTRSVHLTLAGQRFLPVAQGLIDEIDAVAPTLSQLSEERRRVLRVGATPIFAASVMPHVYMRLRDTQPALDLQVFDLPKVDVERRVRSGELDCGLGIFPRRLADLTRRQLFEFDFLYIEARKPRQRLKGREAERRIRWQDLPDLPFVQLHPTSDIQQLIDKQKAASGLPRQAGIPMNNLESLVGMAAAGVGPSIVPSFAVPTDANAPVMSALLTEPVLSLGFHMVTKRGREQPALLEAFTQCLHDVIVERGAASGEAHER